MVKYSIVVPVFNEELILNETYRQLKGTMDKTAEDYEIIFVNDGSQDSSPDIIRAFHKKDTKVKLLDFSRNFGHQIAINAGLDVSTGDAVIIVHADLQDPPEIILEMIKKWKDGYKVVLGKRTGREGEPFLKELATNIYYRLLKYLANYDIPVDVGDFRLIDKEVCNILRTLPEKNRYLRGLVRWVGFKQTFIEYVRHGRIGGKSKVSLSKLIGFGLSGITSFSYKPLILAFYLGLLLCILSPAGILTLSYLKLLHDKTIIAFALLITLSLFFNGILFINLGIIGEYVGRIYEETKKRPLYIVKDKVGFEK
ncbi:MAG: glycosyltransferase family 2 protein [Candidatus Melainabacteria bacterium]|nr:glycosyltransferase family 2 protein [Candidatus Melainabacteria bacterium]